MKEILIISFIQGMLFAGIYVTIISILEMFYHIYYKLHMYWYEKKLYKDTTHLKKYCQQHEKDEF